MTDEVFANLAVGRNDVDDTGGNASFDEHLGEEVGIERGFRSGLQHDGRTRSKCRANLERGDEQRHVPRDDAGANANWFAANDDLSTECTVTTLFEWEVQRVLCKGVEHHGCGQNLTEHGEVVRSTNFAHDEVGELFLASGKELGNLRKKSGTLLRRVVSPRASKSSLGGSNSAVHVGIGCDRNRTDDLFGGRREHLECFVPGGFDPLAPDEELVVRQHDFPFSLPGSAGCSGE